MVKRLVKGHLWTSIWHLSRDSSLASSLASPFCIFRCRALECDGFLLRYLLGREPEQTFPSRVDERSSGNLIGESDEGWNWGRHGQGRV